MGLRGSSFGRGQVWGGRVHEALLRLANTAVAQAGGQWFGRCPRTCFRKWGSARGEGLHPRCLPCACLRARTCARLCVCVRAPECAHASPGVCCPGHTLPWPRAVAGMGVCANTPVLCSARVCRCAQTVWGLASPRLSVGPLSAPSGCTGSVWQPVAPGVDGRCVRVAPPPGCGVRPSPDLLLRWSRRQRRGGHAGCRPCAPLLSGAELPFPSRRPERVGQARREASSVWHRRAGGQGRATRGELVLSEGESIPAQAPEASPFRGLPPSLGSRLCAASNWGVPP